MKNGKFTRRGIATKTMVLVLAVMMIVGVSVGGTLAWLTSKTGAVVNTFTATDIEVALTETKGLNAENKWENKMIPGATYEKDPVVSVTNKTTVDCYLFVKFEETANAQDYLTYVSNLTEAKGWTELEAGVWYRIVKTTDPVKEWHLLEGDTVTVNAENVTKENMKTAAQTKLTYTAYAVQLQGFEGKPADAWAKVAP